MSDPETAAANALGASVAPPPPPKPDGTPQPAATGRMCSNGCGKQAGTLECPKCQAYVALAGPFVRSGGREVDGVREAEEGISEVERGGWRLRGEAGRGETQGIRRRPGSACRAEEALGKGGRSRKPPSDARSADGPFSAGVAGTKSSSK